MTPELKAWITKVKYELLKQGLNQSKLAFGIGVSKPVISDLFNYGKGSDDVKKKINIFAETAFFVIK